MAFEYAQADEQDDETLVSSADMREAHVQGKSPRRRVMALGALVFLLLAGCQDKLRGATTGVASNVPAHPQAVTAEDEASASKAPETKAKGAAIALEGSWISPSCGERAYPRIITFEGERFTAQDRVAPCPPGARCVWSGIIYRTGKLVVEGDVVSLQVDGGTNIGAGAPFPERLRLDPAPIEEVATDAGDPIRCVYSRPVD